MTWTAGARVQVTAEAPAPTPAPTPTPGLAAADVAGSSASRLKILIAAIARLLLFQPGVVRERGRFVRPVGCLVVRAATSSACRAISTTIPRNQGNFEIAVEPAPLASRGASEQLPRTQRKD